MTFRNFGFRIFCSIVSRLASISFLLRNSSSERSVMKGLIGSAPPRFTLKSKFSATTLLMAKNEMESRIELMIFIVRLVVDQ